MLLKVMRRLSFVLPLLVTLFLMSPEPPDARAQGSLAAMEGPLVAVTPAAMDRILLYDTLGTRRELSFGPLEHHIWDFSPEGCRVLFTLAQPGGYPRLYSAALDGSDRRELVAYPELDADAWGVWEPDWSPGAADGSARIAFTMIREQAEGGDVETVHHTAYIDPALTDGPQVPAFYSVTGREFSPRWSPDGAWLAYISFDVRVPGADPLSTAEPTLSPPPGQPAAELPTVDEADLWVVSADGETKYRLTAFTTGSVRDPRWSPDGALIGFIYAPSGNNDLFWMIANQRGAIPTQLSTQWNLTLALTWFPDSSAMLASVRDFQGMSMNVLWRIPLLGNADTDATRYLPDEAFSHADYPAFSADGRYLAFRSGYRLTVVDTLANTWARFDEDLPGNTPPVWTPAGFNSTRACEPGAG